jgi:hypothetical protein
MEVHKPVHDRCQFKELSRINDDIDLEDAEILAITCPHRKSV